MTEQLKVWLEDLEGLHPGARLAWLETPPAFRGRFPVTLWVRVPGRQEPLRFGARFEEFLDRDMFVAAAQPLLAEEGSS